MKTSVAPAFGPFNQSRMMRAAIVSFTSANASSGPSATPLAK